MSTDLRWDKVTRLELDLREAQRRLYVMAGQLDKVTAERDRARATACRLEQQLAHVDPDAKERRSMVVKGSELHIEPDVLVTLYDTGEASVAARFPGDRSWGPPAFGRPA